MIDLATNGGVWTVTLNRPDKANSLTAEMLSRLAEIAKNAMETPDLRAFVVTGAGDKVFSAGADLEAAKAGLATSPLWEEVSGGIAALPCLTIAALNGTLAGGAFGMALACDLRIAVPGARFFYPVARLGFLPQPSDPGRLVDLIGPARTKLLLMSSQKLSAGQAYQFGLVDQIVPLDEMSATLDTLTESARTGNPAVLAQIKQMSAARS